MIAKFISDIFRGKDWLEILPKGEKHLNRFHWYNIVSPSPWPFLISMNTLPIILGFVGYLQGIHASFDMLVYGFVAFLLFYALWNRDIVRESTYMGVHTKQVDANTITGFKLFLFSETMLFVSFFWAHLYSAFYPSVFIGLSWPPVGLENLLLDPFNIPLTNTVVLVYSGFTITLSHLYLRRGSLLFSALALVVTILLGFIFLYFQYTEYSNAQFDISDGIYGSTFYMLTGFHGVHVILGVTALIITLIRLIDLHFSSYSHTGFKLALIYWHFVDIVWIFVFLIVYVIGYDLTYPNSIFYVPNSSTNLNFIIDSKMAYFGKQNSQHSKWNFIGSLTKGNFNIESGFIPSTCPRGRCHINYIVLNHETIKKNFDTASLRHLKEGTKLHDSVMNYMISLINKYSRLTSWERKMIEYNNWLESRNQWKKKRFPCPCTANIHCRRIFFGDRLTNKEYFKTILADAYKDPEIINFLKKDKNGAIKFRITLKVPVPEELLKEFLSTRWSSNVIDLYAGWAIYKPPKYDYYSGSWDYENTRILKW